MLLVTIFILIISLSHGIEIDDDAMTVMNVGDEILRYKYIHVYRIQIQRQRPTAVKRIPSEFNPADTGIRKSAIAGDIYHPVKLIASHAMAKNIDR